MMPSIQNNKSLPDDFLEYGLSHGFGELHFKIDKETGMKAIIAIHSTKLGPALGGCRFIEYADSKNAIYDVMRLAKSMSYKAALSNLSLGGGKAVIIKPTTGYDREAYFHAFGKFVNELGGRYVTALDSGTQLSDMDIIAQHTSYTSSSYNADPSPYTAKTVLRGIEAAVKFKLGRDSLKDLHIAIQGLGHVGYLLAESLHHLGVKLTVADTDPLVVEQAVKAFAATAVAPDTIHSVPCDVFSPCALGASINDRTINELQTSIIAGAANNQLAHAYHGQLLHDKEILYAVDYIVNAGGLILAGSNYLHSPEEKVRQQIDDIYKVLLEIFTRSQEENRPTSEIADNLAEKKLT